MKDQPTIDDIPAAGSRSADPIAAIVFDVDGTLYDHARVRRAMAIELISAHALHPIKGFALMRFLKAYRRAQEDLRGSRLEGQAAEVQFRSACENSKTEAATAHSYLDRWFHTAPLKHVRAAGRPGLKEFLQAMKSRGLKLGVFSDYPANSKLEALGLNGFFDVVVSSDDREVQGFKPDPSGLLRCAERLGVSPRQVLYVGDRPEVDAECARRAGATAAILEATKHGRLQSLRHGYSADSFSSLMDQLLQRGVLG